MKRNLPGPEGLAGRAASAVLRGLAVALATAGAARLVSARSPSQRGSRGMLRQAPGLLAALVLALQAVQGVAAAPAAKAPGAISLDAQSSELDLRNNNVIFRRVRILQGNMSVSADQGQATGQAGGLNFDSSLWVFRGNVKISMDQGQLSADDAEITFNKKALSKAVANGKPAEFQQRIVKTGKIAKGRADTIDYDAAKNTVRLLKNAWLSDGQNEIHGESLKYNLLAQSIVADAAEQGSQRVHIIITPPPTKP